MRMRIYRNASIRVAITASAIIGLSGAISAQDAQSVPEADCSDCVDQTVLETDDSVKTEADRVLKHQTAIEFYWKQMGITLPQDRARSAKAINEMSKEEFQHLLDGIETIGGPKSVPL